MRCPRIFFPHDLRVGTSVSLDDRALHHAVHVLRLRAGDNLILFDGNGDEFRAILKQAGSKTADADILQQVERKPESPLQITLLQAVSRGERMDYTLQKAVELGVTSLQPLWTERTQVRLNGERLTRRLKHWNGVVIHACEQSGRTRLPTLHSPVVLHDALGNAHTMDLRLMLDPGGKSGLRRLISTVRSVAILAGPEGGLSDSEHALARQHDFLALRLGPRILRTETAALAAIAALQTTWGDFG